MANHMIERERKGVKREELHRMGTGRNKGAKKRTVHCYSLGSDLKNLKKGGGKNEKIIFRDYVLGFSARHRRHCQCYQWG